LLRPLITALVLASLLACAGAPARESPRERTLLVGEENRVILILPLNVAAVMPSELELFSPIIWKELELYLRDRGKQLKTISRQAARTLWVRAVKQVRAEGGPHAGYDQAARALAVELRKHTEFDTLLAPSLFIREARISNRRASWDGVSRELEFAARGMAARSLVSTPLEGAAPAASIHVAVFDADGDKLHEARGGIELLVRVRVIVGARSGGDDVVVLDPQRSNTRAPHEPLPSFAFETRTDLFSNREHVRDGFAVAFGPFLPPPLSE